ncbi:MAG: hypothetical protein AB7T38_16600 [Nitrospirales bacterium]
MVPFSSPHQELSGYSRHCEHSLSYGKFTNHQIERVLVVDAGIRNLLPDCFGTIEDCRSSWRVSISPYHHLFLIGKAPFRAVLTKN